MRFVLRMAVRETRASWRRLLFFFVCIAVGVAAIVALRSVIQSVRGVFGTEAKALIAADVVFGTTRDWSDAARAAIDKHLAEAGATARTETIETPTMVRPADGRPVAKVAELRAIQPGFPLYGTMTLQGDRPYSHALVEDHGVIVRPELLDGARRRGRRSHRHRPGDVHDSRACSRTNRAAGWAASAWVRAC